MFLFSDYAILCKASCSENASFTDYLMQSVHNATFDIGLMLHSKYYEGQVITRSEYGKFSTLFAC